jgi:hypothetical protein
MTRILLFLVVSTMLISLGAQGQERFREVPSGRDNGVRRPPYEDIFVSVREGLLSGDVARFGNHLAPQLYVSLRDEESGYFSSNQAYYILDRFLSSRRFLDLQFTSRGGPPDGPYATGGAGYVLRGSRGTAQVYVALSSAGDHWVISRISIY